MHCLLLPVCKRTKFPHNYMYAVAWQSYTSFRHHFHTNHAKYHLDRIQTKDSTKKLLAYHPSLFRKQGKVEALYYNEIWHGSLWSQNWRSDQYIMTDMRLICTTLSKTMTIKVIWYTQKLYNYNIMYSGTEWDLFQWGQGIEFSYTSCFNFLSPGLFSPLQW